MNFTMREMLVNVKTILNNATKPVVFCLSAAIGCFVFALLAELFLFLTAGKPVATVPVTPDRYVLIIDVSGSMAGNKMDEVKRAAKAFIDRSEKPVALVIFSSVGKILSRFTEDKGKLDDFIGKLEAYGGTNFEDAMLKTESVFAEQTEQNGKSAVLLFTDDAPSEGNPQRAADIAYSLRKDGVRIFAVATADGDMPYLAQITGKKDRVIEAANGRIEYAFQEAEKKMNSSLMGGGASSITMSFVRSSGWSIFLCIGIALALVALQNYFLKKNLLQPEQLTFVFIGSVAAGCVSGFIGEASHQIFDIVHLGVLGQVIGWTVLGAALARGMTFFIPNMDKQKVLLFGAGGGLFGSLAFIAVGLNSEIVGRLIGAAIFGACCGTMIGWVEQVFRDLYLTVRYDARNVVQVNLGIQHITVGGGSRDIIHINGVEPNYGVFSVNGNVIQYKTKRGRQTLKPGDSITVGNVELVVRRQYGRLQKG
ncbi:hypothetical protein FACS189454_02580 [Planctomycetales bacterium]|nr:hypothetical protein FACS189454_02580 [Planctomycetales bacterium]